MPSQPTVELRNILSYSRFFFKQLSVPVFGKERLPPFQYIYFALYYVLYY